MMKLLATEFSGFQQFSVGNLEILKTPSEFYCMILEKIKTCESVHLACLLLGSGEQSRTLMDALAERSQRNKKTVLLVDKSRNIQNLELIGYINEKKLTKVIKFVDMTTCRYFPSFVNELLGVYHLKAYVFDDEICISGANLADSYFVDRIDRYYLLRNGELGRVLVDTIFNRARYRERMEPVPKAGLHTICSLSIAKGSREAAPQRAPGVLESGLDHGTQTRIFSFTKDQEISVLERLLRCEYQDVHLSTAYLNFTNDHIKLLRKIPFCLYTPSSVSYTFSPLNRFYRTVVGLYTYSTYKTKFYLPRCQVHEYSRPGCTFHTKGMWLFGEDCCVTIVGSSNFNQRSVKIDEESSWVIISNDQKIRAKLRDEVELLRKYSRAISLKELGNRNVRILVILIYYILNVFI